MHRFQTTRQGSRFPELKRRCFWQRFEIIFIMQRAVIIVLIAALASVAIADYSWSMDFAGKDCTAQEALSGTATWAASSCSSGGPTTCQANPQGLNRSTLANCLSAARFPNTVQKILVIGYTDSGCTQEDARYWEASSDAESCTKYLLSCVNGKVVTTDCDGKNPTTGVSDADGKLPLHSLTHSRLCCAPHQLLYPPR